LLKHDLFSEVIFSVHKSIPMPLLKELKQQGFPVAVSTHDQPQHRLLECMENKNANVAAVLNAYSILMDYKALRNCLALVIENKADAVYAEDVIAPKFFMALNHKASKALANAIPRPIPPFVFAEKLNQIKTFGLRKPVPYSGIETPDERFLWELLFAGERCAIPKDFVERFISKTPTADRLSRHSFHKFITREYGLDDTSFLVEGLNKIAPWEPSLRIAMHINYAKELAAHFPKNTGTALEIGHGKTGMTAQLVGMAFNKTIGVDLMKHSDDGINAAKEFLSLLSEKAPAVLPRKNTINSAPQFLNCRLEEAELEPESVDFCFSRVVLEHIDNMPTLSRELGRIMRPGGVMIHEIGLQDHEDLSHIHFDFLRHSPEEWATMKKSTNLLRVNDFIKLGEESGFSCQVLKRDVRIVRPDSLHPCWDGYADEDLYCHRVVIKSTKKALP
jgi:SAM-dependent methyltransferase